MPRNYVPIEKYPAELLREFIRIEVGGDLTRLTRKARKSYDSLSHQKFSYLHAADEILLECGSHLTFFLDWMNDQRGVG